MSYISSVRRPVAILAVAIFFLVAALTTSAAVITSLNASSTSSLAPGVTYTYQDAQTGQGVQKSIWSPSTPHRMAWICGSVW